MEGAFTISIALCDTSEATVRSTSEFQLFRTKFVLVVWDHHSISSQVNSGVHNRVVSFLLHVPFSAAGGLDARNGPSGGDVDVVTPVSPFAQADDAHPLIGGMDGHEFVVSTRRPQNGASY